MMIELKKFGTMLVSRQAGREAFAALQPALRGMKENENLEVDFAGVLTFSPSWGDEFLTPLVKSYGGRVHLKRTENPSVRATLTILKESTGLQFGA